MVLIPFLLRILPWLLGAIAIFGFWEAEQHRCNTACQTQTKRADAAELTLKETNARNAAIISGLATEWDKQRQRADSAARAAEVAHAGEVSALAARASALAGASGPLPAAVERLYIDAAAAASAYIAGPAGGTQRAVAPPSNSTEEYVTALDEWAGKCGRRVEQIIDFYDSVRNAQPPPDSVVQ